MGQGESPLRSTGSCGAGTNSVVVVVVLASGATVVVTVVMTVVVSVVMTVVVASVVELSMVRESKKWCWFVFGFDSVKRLEIFPNDFFRREIFVLARKISREEYVRPSVLWFSLFLGASSRGENLEDNPTSRVGWDEHSSSFQAIRKIALNAAISVALGIPADI